VKEIAQPQDQAAVEIAVLRQPRLRLHYEIALIFVAAIVFSGASFLLPA